jgi:hypothetical protein
MITEDEGGTAKKEESTEKVQDVTTHDLAKEEVVENAPKEVMKEMLSEDDFSASFFETSIEELENEGVENDYVSDPNMYAPTLEDEKAVNREYKSHIRFLKNPRRTPTNGKKNIISKYVVFIQNPNNPNSKMMVDDISHINRDNIITNAFFHTRNSKSLAMQNMGKQNFSRRSYNWTLAKIEKDSQHPELENQIKVFRFANQVDEIMTKALENKPEDGIIAKLYSDPIKGFKFILNINEKEVDNKAEEGKKFMMTNYTDSRFVDQPSVLQFDGVPADWHTTKEGMGQMFKYINENCPVLEDYEAKAWDEDTEKMVIEAVRKLIDDPIEFEKIYYKTYKKSYYNDQGDDSPKASIPSDIDVDEFAEKPKKVETKIDDSSVQNANNIEDIGEIDLDDEK